MYVYETNAWHTQPKLRNEMERKVVYQDKF